MEHGFACGQDSPPANALKIGHQHDSGHYYVAVANTEWGRIPGKAKDGTCWYSYWDNEHTTNDFDYVTHPTTMSLVQDEGCGPPAGALPVGYQNDGGGPQFAAIANTEWGTIPGKANSGSCCYGMCGEEHETCDFQWLVCSRVSDPHHQRMDIDFVKQDHPPENGLMMGYQNDGGGDQWIVVADTPYGKIPGKANGDTCCYTYGGKEYATQDFHYLTYTCPHSLVRSDGSGPPCGAVPVGCQTDGGGDQYAVIALSEWGRIPGKAANDTSCYGYDGQEHATTDFEWVVFKEH